jgi:hypothetical protein
MLTESRIDYIINNTLNNLYNDGICLKGSFDKINKGVDPVLSSSERHAAITKMTHYDLIQIIDTHSLNVEGTENVVVYIISLSEKSKGILYEHGSYLNYLSSQKKESNKKKKHENFERLLRYFTGIIAILATVSTTYLSIVSSIDKKERLSLEQDKQQALRQFDSLKQVLSTQQKQKDSTVLK